MFSKFSLLVLLAIVHSFQIPQHVLVNTHRSFTSLRVFSPSEAFDSPSLTLSLVDSIPFVDPVVVSGAFWSVLRGKVISVLIGNLLATIFLFVVGKVVIDVVFKGGGLNRSRSSASSFRPVKRRRSQLRQRRSNGPKHYQTSKLTSRSYSSPWQLTF